MIVNDERKSLRHGSVVKPPEALKKEMSSMSIDMDDVIEDTEGSGVINLRHDRHSLQRTKFDAPAVNPP